MQSALRPSVGLGHIVRMFTVCLFAGEILMNCALFFCVAKRPLVTLIHDFDIDFRFFSLNLSPIGFLLKFIIR